MSVCLEHLCHHAAGAAGFAKAWFAGGTAPIQAAATLQRLGCVLWPGRGSARMALAGSATQALPIAKPRP